MDLEYLNLNNGQKKSNENKVQVIIILVIAIIRSIFFLMIYQPGAGTYVTAEEINDPP